MEKRGGWGSGEDQIHVWRDTHIHQLRTVLKVRLLSFHAPHYPHIPLKIHRCIFFIQHLQTQELLNAMVVKFWIFYTKILILSKVKTALILMKCSKAIIYFFLKNKQTKTPQNLAAVSNSCVFYSSVVVNHSFWEVG